MSHRSRRCSRDIRDKSWTGQTPGYVVLGGVFVAALALTACGGSNDATGPASPPGEPARVSVQSGDQQTAAVTEELADPMRARVEDADGQSIPDVTVSWVITAGGGSVFSPATETGSDGTTQNRWTLGENAGPQELEVRWVDPETGDARVLGTFQATAEPGPAVTFAVVDDTSRTLVVGDTSRVLLEGQDEFGNAIEAGDVAATWSSNDPAVASVDREGLVSADSNGETVISAWTTSDTARVRIQVNPGPVTVFETPGIVWHFHRGGGRFLGFGSLPAGGTTEGGVISFDGSVWTEEERIGTSLANGWVFGDGDAWFGHPRSDSESVWRSQAAGSWSAVAGNPNRGKLTGLAGELIAHLTSATDSATGASVPNVWTWSSGTWTDLGSPPARGDSTWQVLSLAGVTVGIRATNEIYAAGLREPSRASGAGRASLALWNGTDWSLPAMPSEVFEGRSSAVTHLSADPTGGPLYGLIVIDGSERRTLLFSVSEGSVAIVDNPLTDAGLEIKLSGLRVGPSGSVHLVSAGRVVWQDGAGWNQLFAPEDWQFLGPIWVDGDGTLWLSAVQQTTSGQESAVLRLRP